MTDEPIWDDDARPHAHILAGPHPDSGLAPDVDEAHYSKRRAAGGARSLVACARDDGHTVTGGNGYWEIDNGTEFGQFVAFLDECKRNDCEPLRLIRSKRLKLPASWTAQSRSRASSDGE